MELSNKAINAWNKGKFCNCSDQDCGENHRLCGICGGTMIYGAHESAQPSSKYAWNIDHINPLFLNGSNDINNLQAVHITCNRSKASN